MQEIHKQSLISPPTQHADAKQEGAIEGNPDNVEDKGKGKDEDEKEREGIKK